jgi:hypothetical protein
MHRVALALAVLLAGCSQSASPSIDIPHVHGLAYEAFGDTLYVATHHGLARGIREDGRWSWSYVGDRYDYMGFTQDAERAGVFYSSGHPDDPRAYGGVHLGLRRSMDGGLTWEQRSLKGEVDFHALTAMHGGEGWLAGYWQGAIKVSRDGGLTWTNQAAPTATVLALGSSDGQVLAGTSGGLYRTTDLVDLTGWTRVPGPSDAVVSSIGVSRDGANMLAGTGDGRTGSTYRSTDAGATWVKLDQDHLADAPGQVLFAFSREDPVHAFAALGDGKVWETTDAGASWAIVR